MPTERNLLDQKLTIADRDLKGVEAVVLLLLVCLIGYGTSLIYVRDWEGLVGLLPIASAVCVALLVAKTATRLLTYYMLVRADDRAHDIVRVTHHCIAVINDLRGRVHFLKLALTEGNRPLIAITQNADAINRRYEVLYDRALYLHLPGDVIDAIGSLSGSVSGLLSLVAGVESSLGGQGHLLLPSMDPTKHQALAEACSRLDVDLDALLSKVVKLRIALE